MQIGVDTLENYPSISKAILNIAHAYGCKREDAKVLELADKGISPVYDDDFLSAVDTYLGSLDEDKFEKVCAANSTREVDRAPPIVEEILDLAFMIIC